MRSGEDEPILGRDLFERSRRDRAPYTLWRDQGLLIATGGNKTDFQFIEIVRNLRRLSLVEFARVIQADSDLQG